MTQQHPITPPPELAQEWWAEETYDPFGVAVSNLANRAAQWGADQELEACCEWLEDPDLNVDTYKLRAARRPKPPSLKEEALAQLDHLLERAYKRNFAGLQVDTIRRALEQLDD